MDLLILAAGVYVIVHYIIMVTSGTLRQNMLLPKDINVNKCKDTKAYIQSVGTKQLIFGISAMLCGILGLIQDYTQKFGSWGFMVVMVLFLAIAAWYSAALKKAFKTYWD